jgi:iron complex transport system substrate-binding protein
MGVRDLLVGRTEYDTASTLVNLPSIGEGLNPNIESLILLEPDLVIRFEGEADLGTPGRLDELGISHFAVRLDRVADVLELFENLGTIAGVSEQASLMISEVGRELAEIQHRVRERPKPRVAYLLGGNPPWVAGPDTFIDELLTIAGGENVFSDLSVLYGPVSLEEFILREIDILLAPEGTEVPQSISAIPIERVPATVELPGPDLARSALTLARLFHPEVFR